MNNKPPEANPFADHPYELDGAGIPASSPYTEEDWRKMGYHGPLVNLHPVGGGGEPREAGKVPDLRAMQETVRQGLENGTIKPQPFVEEQLSLNLATAVSRGVASAKDMVNLPPHYSRFKIEPIRFIAENKLDWFQGNIIKYVMRHDAKNGSEDIRKTIRYANMYLLFLQGDPDWWKAGKPEDFQHGQH